VGKTATIGKIESISTLYRQIISLGDQVAYVSPLTLRLEPNNRFRDELVVKAKGARLKVSEVESIEKTHEKIGQFGPSYRITLANGDTLDPNAEVFTRTDQGFDGAQLEDA
jgi:hypothetical protein